VPLLPPEANSIIVANPGQRERQGRHRGGIISKKKTTERGKMKKGGRSDRGSVGKCEIGISVFSSEHHGRSSKKVNRKTEQNTESGNPLQVKEGGEI